jgi:DNA-binding IscR family transcriptional regulator
LADIVAIVDPPEPKKCHGNESTLTRTLYAVWHEMHALQHQRLSSTTLADLVARAQRADDLAYEI